MSDSLWERKEERERGKDKGEKKRVRREGSERGGGREKKELREERRRLISHGGKSFPNTHRSQSNSSTGVTM